MITPTEFETYLACLREWVAEQRALVVKANQEVSGLCRGSRRWTMSIPARPDSDSDLVISRALWAGQEALDTIEAQQAEVERLQARIDKAGALHRRDLSAPRHRCLACGALYPCPTARALTDDERVQP